jgi:hypothetical protein
MAGMSNSKQSIGQTCLSSSADLYRVDVHVQQQRIEGNQSKPMNRTNGMQAGHGGVHAHGSLRTRVHIRDTIFHDRPCCRFRATDLACDRVSSKESIDYDLGRSADWL